MRRHALFFLCILFALLTASAAGAVDMDPILLNKEDPSVVGCNDDYFIEIDGRAVVSATLGKYSAKSGELYLALIVKTLFLPMAVWNDGFAPETFSISYSGPNGEWSGSLNTAMTEDRVNQKDYDMLSDTLAIPSYKTYRLVFTIPSYITDKENWTLHFNPTEYFEDEEVDDWDFDADVGSKTNTEAMCTSEIAFRIQ